MAHAGATLAHQAEGSKAPAKPRTKPKTGDHVRWEFSMYLRGVERGYSGFGVVEGECQVVAHPGFRIKVTEVELGHGSIFEGSRVEALAHRCEVWPVGVHWKQPLVEVGDSDEKVGDCAPQEPAKAPENGHQPEIQSPTKMDAEPCQMGLF